MNEIIQELNNLNDLGAHSIQSSSEFNPTSNDISDNPAEIGSSDASYTFDPKHSTSNTKKTSSSIPNLNTSDRNSKTDGGEVTNPSASSDASKTQDCDTLNSNNQKSTSDNGKNQSTSQQNQAAIPNLGNSNNKTGTTEHQSAHSSEKTNDPSKIPDSSDTKEEASDSLDTPKPEDCDQDNQSSKTTTTNPTNPKPKSSTSQNSYQSDSMGSNQAVHESGNEINPTHQIQSQKEKNGGDYV